MSQISIHAGSWQDLQADAKVIREAVFIQEQVIAPEDEWDQEDAVALHFVAYAQQQPIATARLLSNHSIGRVAVLKSYRGLGLGKKVMEAIIQQAQQEQRPFLVLSAQVYATGFYQSLVFRSKVRNIWTVAFRIFGCAVNCTQLKKNSNLHPIKKRT